MTTAPLSAETIKNFLYASTATVSMQMLKRGFRNSAINGVRPLNPKATRLVGPAFTLRYIPGREDLDKPPTPSDPPSAQREAIEGTPAGHVLVIGTEGTTRAGTLGDILALRLKVRGVAARPSVTLAPMRPSANSMAIVSPARVPAAVNIGWPSWSRTSAKPRFSTEWKE